MRSLLPLPELINLSQAHHYGYLYKSIDYHANQLVLRR